MGVLQTRLSQQGGWTTRKGKKMTMYEFLQTAKTYFMPKNWNLENLFPTMGALLTAPCAGSIKENARKSEAAAKLKAK
jgi:hypothetical protein